MPRKESISDLVDKAKRQAESLEWIARQNQTLTESQVASLNTGADLLRRLAAGLDYIHIELKK